MNKPYYKHINEAQASFMKELADELDSYLKGTGFNAKVWVEKYHPVNINVVVSEFVGDELVLCLNPDLNILEADINFDMRHGRYDREILNGLTDALQESWHLNAETIAKNIVSKLVKLEEKLQEKSEKDTELDLEEASILKDIANRLALSRTKSEAIELKDRLDKAVKKITETQ